MNLKKSDKIIALIGVAILVIAGIIIVLSVNEEEDDGDKTPEEVTIMYNVESKETDPLTALPDNTVFNVKDYLLRDGSYNGIVAISQENLKSVTFTITYKDGFYSKLASKLGLKIGQDTITVTIKDNSGNEIVSKEKIRGEGNITEDIMFAKVYPTEIEAKSYDEALDKLKQEYCIDDVSYEIKVSLDRKEGILRPLAKFLDKLSGDKFTLEVTYDYYDFDLVEQEKETDQGNNDSDGDNETGGYTYSGLLHTGFH